MIKALEKENFKVKAYEHGFGGRLPLERTNLFFKSAKVLNEKVRQITQNIPADDTMNLKALRRAIFQARAGVKHDNSQAFPIKLIRSEMVSNGGIAVQNYSL
ncbi:hypothetical protein [Helicobacter suis]|uniref:hypothetical protein n=1 Tax=Helicobacter suis TaxID=104628 RepID=UPI0031FC8AC6